MGFLGTAFVVAAGGSAWWYLRERSLRRTHAMPAGLHPDRRVAHAGDVELWHNAFSLCSKKVRMCLAELSMPYTSRHVDLIETGSYETLGRQFLAINPAGLVPVLVHRGAPVYESHEILRYAAQHAPNGASLVPEDADDTATMEEWIRRSSLFGDNPLEHIDESAGNCVPGLTVPLFAAMIADIPVGRILEGLLFHRLKQRPAFFLLLKLAGLGRLASLGPVLRAIHDSHKQMERHLDALEAHLATPRGRSSVVEGDRRWNVEGDGRANVEGDDRSGAGGGTRDAEGNRRSVAGGDRQWIAGDRFTLADISWAVILERLREADWNDLLESPRRPHVAAWWRRVRDRASYREAMLGEMEHPLVRRAAAAIRALKTRDERFRREVYRG